MTIHAPYNMFDYQHGCFTRLPDAAATIEWLWEAEPNLKHGLYIECQPDEFRILLEINGWGRTLFEPEKGTFEAWVEEAARLAAL